MAAKVAEVVVSLVTTLSVAKRKALAEGTLQTEEKPLKLKGAINLLIRDPPSDALPKAQKWFEQAVRRGEWLPATGVVLEAHSSFLLQCPKCGTHIEAARRRLLDGAIYRSISCTHCCKQLRASKWLCVCSKPWHVCVDHRQMGLSCERPLEGAAPLLALEALLISADVLQFH